MNDHVFYDLSDALRKAHENCANVSQRCNVTIYLLGGSDHYLFRKSLRTFYIPSKSEKESSVMTTTIQPWFCDLA